MAAADSYFRFGATTAHSVCRVVYRSVPRLNTTYTAPVFHSSIVHRHTTMTRPSAVLLQLILATVTAAKVTVNVTHLCHPRLSPAGSATTAAPSTAVSVATVAASSSTPPLSSKTELLLAVRRKPYWTGFAYARRTDVPASIAPAAAGPVALGQTRFPSAKYGENVKLDQQMSRPDFGGTVVGPFGVGFAVGDAGLRFVGVVEAAVMWHSVPAELALDLVTNAYDWDVVMKKVKQLDSRYKR